jgi:hypothetical protein
LALPRARDGNRLGAGAGLVDVRLPKRAVALTEQNRDGPARRTAVRGHEVLTSQQSALKSPTVIPRAAPASEMSIRGRNVPFPFPSRIEIPVADAFAVTRSRWSSSST